MGHFIESFPVLVVIVPLIIAAITPILRPLGRDVPWLLSVGASGFSFAVSLKLLESVYYRGPISYWLGGWQPPWGIEYALDTLNGFVLVVVSLVAFLVAVYSRNSVRSEIPEDKNVTFYTLYSLLTAGLLGIVITGDIFNMYVFIEISSLAGYAMIASGRKREALTATFNYLILGTVGATFIIIGVGLLYMVTGTLNIADLAVRLQPLYGSRVVLTAFAFFSVGISLKIALFPLHIWMPAAYTQAPSAVSSILAATSTKVGAYALIRVMYTVFGLEFDTGFEAFTHILLFLASLGIIFGSVLAMAQTNIKTMLAYSSVGQIGYIVLGAAIANQTALAGGIIHILNHALMKGSLFMVVGIVVYRSGLQDISALRGMGRKMPWTMAAFTVAGLSMVGVPLTVGFISKWYLAIGALEAGMWYLLPVILISSVLTAIYFWRIIESIYFEKPIEGTENASDAPAGMLVPTLAMATLCIVFGIAASIPATLAKQAAAALLGGGM